jgi:hypothetical protein
MSTTNLIIVISLAVVVLGVIALLVFVRHNRSEAFHKRFGSEYDNAVQELGGDKNAQDELEKRRKHVEALDIHPLSEIERERYAVDWDAIQAKFVDGPGQAIVAADRLIMEVMQMRAYPISDFEQRAADVSISYPEFASNYRAAHEIALKNANQQATTEELRLALVYYRALFEELLGPEPAAV